MRRHVTSQRELPARPGTQGEWPAWADASLVAGYRALGVERPWEHQVEAADAAWSGRHVALLLHRFGKLHACDPWVQAAN